MIATEDLRTVALRVSIPRRAEALMKWLWARPEERHGCLAIGRCGGTYSFSHRLPFVSPTHHIYVRRPCYTDVHMERLRPFRGLVAADVGDTSITERGVACLRDCTELRYLFLWGTQVGNGILDVLRDMPKLDMLNLSGTHVSREVFVQICELLPNALVGHADFGDCFRDFHGAKAMSKWLQRNDPNPVSKSR